MEDWFKRTIRQALDEAGYSHLEATPEALRECFLDYVATGYWQDLELEETREDVKNGAISERDMIRALRG